jgi:hypothetical protein
MAGSFHALVTRRPVAAAMNWRATAGFAAIRGNAGDFLGQYRRNSHGILALRYSF